MEDFEGDEDDEEGDGEEEGSDDDGSEDEVVFGVGIKKW